MTSVTSLTERSMYNWSAFLLRVALGIVFLVAGAGKVLNIGPKAAGIDGFAGFLMSLGVPFPTLFAWVVGLVELVGGFLLLVGLFTRYAAILLAIDMAVATWVVHLPNGFAAGTNGIEFTMTLFLVTTALVLSGPGRYALEYAIFGRELMFTPGEESAMDGNIKA